MSKVSAVAVKMLCPQRKNKQNLILAGEIYDSNKSEDECLRNGTRSKPASKVVIAELYDSQRHRRHFHLVDKTPLGSRFSSLSDRRVESSAIANTRDQHGQAFLCISGIC